MSIESSAPEDVSNNNRMLFDEKDWSDEEVKLVEFCQECNCGALTDVCAEDTEERNVCGIVKFIFTHAIIRDFNYSGYSQRWCFHTHEEALSALESWKLGEPEPKGFIRSLGVN